jgi:hypothetical protein
MVLERWFSGSGTVQLRITTATAAISSADIPIRRPRALTSSDTVARLMKKSLPRECTTPNLLGLLPMPGRTPLDVAERFVAYVGPALVPGGVPPPGSRGRAAPISSSNQ